MSTHRTLTGEWTECTDETCTLLYHLDLTATEAQLIPTHIFEALAEAIDPPTHVNDSGTKFWHRGFDRHRDYDLPAQVHADGTRIWYQNNDQHRDGDKPALVMANGTMIWAQHGVQHRGGDQPARINADGYMEWWVEGELQRTNDPAFPLGVEAQHGQPV